MDELIIIDKPNSTFSEEIKKVRTNLQFSAVNEDMKVIMITSSVPGEGKSLISANLACAFAQSQESVLLIDCDLRRGRQKKVFGLVKSEKTNGLSNLLINKNWKEEYVKYIKKTKVDNLYVITAGAFPPNPSELLSSRRFENLLTELKESFDIIILDCPPVTGLNDSLILGSRADATILVARYRKTSMELLQRTKKTLENVGVKLTGVILNQINAKETNYYFGEYYSTDNERHS